MDPYQQVKEKLDELGISFDVVEHPPAFTTEQADSYIEGLVIRTKTMFLTNKNSQCYALIMDDREPLDMDDFKEQVRANRIKPADSLAEKCNYRQYGFSFGLLNNERYSCLFDKDDCQRRS